MMAQVFSSYASDSKCPLLTTQSGPFLAVLNELKVGGGDPSTIHQPACLGITSPTQNFLSSDC